MLSELFTTGLSMAMMLVLTNIGTVAMQGSVNSFGASTITGHTAARKFHDLCMLPLGTICTSTATFVNQNFGAHKKSKIKEGIKSSLILGTVWSKIVPIVVSIIELIGKFAGVLWLAPVFGYMGICWIEPLTWLVCLPIVTIALRLQIKAESHLCLNL